MFRICGQVSLIQGVSRSEFDPSTRSTALRAGRAQDEIQHLLLTSLNAGVAKALLTGESDVHVHEKTGSHREAIGVLDLGQSKEAAGSGGH